MKTLTSVFVIALIVTTAVAQEKKSKMDPAAGVRSMEERWEAAIQKRDAKTIGDMIASDFAGVSDKNKFTTRATMLERTKKDTDNYTSTKLENLKVRLYGPNTAVAMGDAVEKGTGKDGKAFNRTFRFTDTWVDRNGQWQCVAEQVAQISGAPTTD